MSGSMLWRRQLQRSIALINQLQRAAMARESVREGTRIAKDGATRKSISREERQRPESPGKRGTTIAKDGAEATTIAEDGAKAKKADKQEAAIFFFFSKRAPCGRKEAGIMPAAMMGAASPWFIGAGSDPAGGEVRA